MDTVVLKVRQLIQESQYVTEWETAATFHSAIKNRVSPTQNTMEPDYASVTVYLPGQSDQLLQLSWLFSHSRQPSSSNRDEESRTSASISDISMAVMKEGLDFKSVIVMCYLPA